jgi:DNA-binding LacI/PurR family transcriptional regulator
MMATLQAVAVKAGVSVSTASRCLSGAPNVAKATQARVREAAENLKYHYNPLVNQVMRATRLGLTQQHLGMLAYVTPCEDAQEWKTTPTLSQNWQAACTRAESLGFGVADFPLHAPGMTERRLGEILQARGISGILLAAFPNEPFEISLPWNNFAVVLVGHDIHQPRLDCVVSDHTEAIITSARVLAQRGYRRIGLAIESYQDHITDQRWTLGHAGLSVMVKGLVDIPPLLPERINKENFLSWVEKNRIDCVLTLSTFRNQPNEMEKWLATRPATKRPHVGLVSLDVTTVHPDWAGIEQHSAEIGKAAVDLLLGKLRASEKGIPTVPRTLQVHGQWHEGRTVRSVPL